MCVCKKGGRQGWRKEEATASREMGSASLKPPCCCCCWRDISVYFQPCLFAFLLLSFSLWLGFFISISLPCVCVACALQCFPSFVSFPFISPFYRFSLLFSLSSCINYLSLSFLPSSSRFAELNPFPSLTRIGSYGSNRVQLSPAAVRIKFLSAVTLLGPNSLIILFNFYLIS